MDTRSAFQSRDKVSGCWRLGLRVVYDDSGTRCSSRQTCRGLRCWVRTVERWAVDVQLVLRKMRPGSVLARSLDHWNMAE